MSAGEVLTAGQFIVSCGGACGAFTLIMQGDGNLVLYQEGWVPVWASAWYGAADPGAYAVMQGDGNLVVYGPGCPGGVCWNSGTAGNPGAELSVQDDGNLVIYGPGCAGLNGSCWASGTGTQATVTVQSVLPNASQYCFATSSFYTQDAATYFTSNGQTYYLPDPAAWVDVPGGLGGTVDGSFQCCYLDGCYGDLSCWTPSGNVPCICTQPQYWSNTIDQCQDASSICQ